MAKMKKWKDANNDKEDYEQDEERNRKKEKL
jgi:hypothetical protein